MGSTQKTWRSHGLRDLSRVWHPQIQRREETPRTTRPRLCHRDTIQTKDRHRVRRHRLAVLISVGLLSIMTPAPAQAAPAQDCPQHHAILKRYGLPPKIFGPIAWRESRCSFTSISAIRKSTGRPDVGLLQVSGSWATVTRNICQVTYRQVIKALTRPDCHLRVAAYLYDGGKGLGHWRATSGTR